MSDMVTQTIFEVKIPPPEKSKGEREYEAFLRLLPELLLTHKGLHVAIHDGKVVDTDTDDIALIKRVHTRVGYVPIHVGEVTDQPRVIRIPRYREYERGTTAKPQAALSSILTPSSENI